MYMKYLVAVFVATRLLSWPWRLLRGWCFPLGPESAAYRYNRLLGRFIAARRGGRVAFDRGGYAYEVVDGTYHGPGDVEIDHRRNPCCSHCGVDYNDASYAAGSTTWQGKRPDRNSDHSRFVKRLLGPTMARRLRAG